MSIGELVRAVGVSQPGITRTVGQLSRLGLVQVEPGRDLRHRSVSLKDEGKFVAGRARLHIWPRVGKAVERLLAGHTAELLSIISEAEDALLATPLERLAAHAPSDALTIREHSDELAHEFHDINVEWISDMFSLEETDRAVLANPAAIIEGGGTILFVEARGPGIVGTCALRKTGGTGYELTKMGVRSSARGLKAGAFLLTAVVERAMKLGASSPYLLTNRKNAAAIHLYEKIGFRHDAAIMAEYDARYARCDAAMRYVVAT